MKYWAGEARAASLTGSPDSVDFESDTRRSLVVLSPSIFVPTRIAIAGYSANSVHTWNTWPDHSRIMDIQPYKRKSYSCISISFCFQLLLKYHGVS